MARIQASLESGAVPNSGTSIPFHDNLMALISGISDVECGDVVEVDEDLEPRMRAFKNRNLEGTPLPIHVKEDVQSMVSIAPATPSEMPCARCDPLSQTLSQPIDAPLVFHRQDGPPPYLSSECDHPTVSSDPHIVRTTTIFPRCTQSSAESARINRRLLHACRRNLMMYNVPWKGDGAIRQVHDGKRPATSLYPDLAKPSTSQVWRSLRKHRNGLSTYVTVRSTDTVLPIVSPVAFDVPIGAGAG